MTTGHNMSFSRDEVAVAASTAATDFIAVVDAVARQMYRRARAAGPEFADTATEVRSLHSELKYLLIEAEDVGSVLSQDIASSHPAESLYTRRLQPVLEDCDSTLNELGAMLDRYGVAGGDGADDRGALVKPGALVDDRVRKGVARIQSMLSLCKTNIDNFLAMMQLQYPARTRQSLDNANPQQMDTIKDKVDAIARRLFRRGSSRASDNEEELWMQFRSELEREGFSSDILAQHSQVLRAYIRELDLHGYLESENPPSVRGLLDHQPRNVPDMAIVPASYPGPQNGGGYLQAGYSPQAQQYSQELQPHQSQSYQPPATLYPHGSSGISYERSGSSSDDESSDTAVSSDLTLISTRDLLYLDHREADMAVQMKAMQLAPQLQLPVPQPYSISPGTSPNGRYLPAAPQPIPIMGGSTLPPPVPLEYQLSSSPASQQLMNLSPRNVPPILVPGHGGPASPASPFLLPQALSGASPAGTGPLVGFSATQYSRLQPDSQGNHIPLDATWTKIKRHLVSPEVLERAGVRYEARPDYVAVLGVLSREHIMEYARLSDLARRARRPNRPHRSRKRNEQGRNGAGHPSTRNTAAQSNGDPAKPKKHEQSDSESDVLWDESDTTDVETQPSPRRRTGTTGSDGNNSKPSKGASSAARDKYTPKTFIDPSAGDKDSSDDKGTRVYPFIVAEPTMSGGNGGGASASADGKVSPSATVPPKSILKNKNENHVRFDSDGPREVSQDELRREAKHRDHNRKRRESSGKDRDGKTRDGKDRAARDHNGHRRSGQQQHGGKDGQKARATRSRSSAWAETVGAVGIGGAAASLLTVLAEAAAGF